MNESYTFKKYNFEDSIFHNIDATYIIHLEGNGRLSSIENQLSEFHPTNNTYIVFNKGYKNSNKQEYVNTSSKDLIDAFFIVFKDARAKKYQNILILEDDFQFNSIIKEDSRVHGKNIDQFLADNISESFIYYLGALTYLQSGFFETSPRLNLSTGTHACIYSKKCIDYFLDKVNQESLEDWDICLNFGVIPRYKYYMPLCYQTFPDTENSKNWHRDSTLLFIFVFIQRTLFKTLGLHISAEPGFSIMETISRSLFWILFIFFFILFIKKIHNHMKN